MKGIHIPLDKIVWKECTGEAHSNPWIDHCMVCLPYWGTYPTCPYCGSKLVNLSKLNYICYVCKEEET